MGKYLIVRISKRQFEQFESYALQNFLAHLYIELKEHYPELDSKIFDELFRKCQKDCSGLEIDEEDGMEAYFSASFYFGEPLRSIPGYDESHQSEWRQSGSSSALPTNIYDKILRDHELL